MCVKITTVMSHKHLENEVDKLMLLVSKKKPHELSFEQSYRTIYNMCNININSEPCGPECGVSPHIFCCACCGYCMMLAILKKYEYNFDVKNVGLSTSVEKFRVLVDICLYPLNQKKSSSNAIKKWFGNHITNIYNTVVCTLLCKYGFPKDICFIISSHVYNNSHYESKDLQSNVQFLYALILE